MKHSPIRPEGIPSPKVQRTPLEDALGMGKDSFGEESFPKESFGSDMTNFKTHSGMITKMFHAKGMPLAWGRDAFGMG